MKFRTVSILSAITVCIGFFPVYGQNFHKEKHSKAHNYYLDFNGNDVETGTKSKPWKSIEKLNSISLHSGDSVFFRGNQTFKGNIVLDSTNGGTKGRSIVITSYGNASAVIDGGNLTALTVDHSHFIKIRSLTLLGSGRKSGNSKDGLLIKYSKNIDVENVDIEGFQKAGLLIYASFKIAVTNVKAHDNGFAGISVLGENTKQSCSNIHITGCTATNNPGDPTNFGNHSGNGIIAGFCKNVLIEYSTATNNGWDMPRTGNGPVGIWCYEADSVTIQYCISYRNKTSAGGGDGGGFDFDGGVTNSVIQRCLSYENQGSGFGIFQYAGASDWHDNIIRNNISENDGNVSPAGANAFIWNGSDSERQFVNLQFYNNILYNNKGASISYDGESRHKGFRFYNNIFVAKKELLKGKDKLATNEFLRNDWWSIEDEFRMDSIFNFKLWAHKTGKEIEKGEIVGFNMNPQFKKPGNTSLTSPYKITKMTGYRLPEKSPLKEMLPDFLK